LNAVRSRGGRDGKKDRCSGRGDGKRKKREEEKRGLKRHEQKKGRVFRWVDKGGS